MGTCWEMGNGWKTWKLDGHGQVSWWSLFCLAHFHMFLHMFAVTSELPVFCSLSLILIAAHPARRTESSTSDKANAHPVQWCGILLVTYWYHLPAMRKFLLHCSTSENEDKVRASAIQDQQTHHTKILQSSMGWTVCGQKFHIKGRPICDPSCPTTSLVKWCHESSLRPHVLKRSRYSDPFW